MLANISSQLRSSHDDIQQDLRSVLVLIISEIQDLDARFRLLTRPNLVPAPTLSRASVMPGAVLSTKDLRIHAETENQSSMGTNSHGTTMALTRAHSRFSRHQVNDICNTLVTQIETIFRLVIACALVALQEFLVFFPHVLFLARMMRFLPGAISLVRQDCIRFEDALGRIENLQYQHFRNWQIFEAMVHCNFKGVPRSRKILRGRYTLTSPRLPGQRLTAASWGGQVFPGMTVIMAVNVRAGGIQDAGCPKCLTSNTSSCSATMSRCHSCGLTFSRDFVTNIVSTSGNNNSIRTLGSTHDDGRKSNNTAGRRDLEGLQRVMRWLRSQNSDESGRRLEELPDDDLAKLGLHPATTDDMSAKPDYESSDSEDDTEDLKIFKRVNLLQRRKKKSLEMSAHLSLQSNERELRGRREDTATEVESSHVEDTDCLIGYPLTRVWARVSE
jgi:hypothetical protein